MTGTSPLYHFKHDQTTTTTKENPKERKDQKRKKCVPSLGSFQSILIFYSDFDSCYSHFMPYQIIPSVRHRAIEVYNFFQPPIPGSIK